MLRRPLISGDPPLGFRPQPVLNRQGRQFGEGLGDVDQGFVPPQMERPRSMTMPRSTSQTSPRRGLAIASLSRVQVEEQLFSDSDESIVAYITRFALNNLP